MCPDAEPTPSWLFAMGIAHKRRVKLIAGTSASLSSRRSFTSTNQPSCPLVTRGPQTLEPSRSVSFKKDTPGCGTGTQMQHIYRPPLRRLRTSRKSPASRWNWKATPVLFQGSCKSTLARYWIQVFEIFRWRRRCHRTGSKFIVLLSTAAHVVVPSSARIAKREARIVFASWTVGYNVLRVHRCHPKHKRQ